MRLFKSENRKVLLFIASIIVIIALMLIDSCLQERMMDELGGDGVPLYIMFNDMLYRNDPRMEPCEEPEILRQIGIVESRVKRSETPTGNNQANWDIVGYAIYGAVGDECIYVVLDPESLVYDRFAPSDKVGEYI